MVGEVLIADNNIDNGHMRDRRPAGGFWGLLTARDQALLTAAGRTSVFSPGATVCVQGEPATHVFVLVSGWVKVVSVTSDGQQAVLALRVVGELAGEVTGYRTATIYAVGPVRSLIVAHDRFSAFLDANPPAARAYRHVLTRRWSEAADHLRSRSTATGAQRLARLLLELAERHGRGDERRVVIAVPLSQQELASLASTSRATVTRALSDWRRRRLIRTGPRQITVTDLPAFRRTAGPGPDG
jgi:CRP/FNR family transcriptional regulator, cyclic AMP receptor protein